MSISLGRPRPMLARRSPGVGIRVIATVLVGVVLVLLARAPLPQTFDAMDLQGRRLWIPFLSVGVQPFLAAFALVECVALILPATRRLRVGSPADRTKLTIASLIAGGFFSLLSSVVATYWMARNFEAHRIYFNDEAVVFWGASLFVGSVLCVACAQFIGAWALTDGYSLVLGALLCAAVIAPLPNGVSFSGERALVVTAGCLAIALGVFVVLTRGERLFGISIPACGLVPFGTEIAIANALWLALELLLFRVPSARMGSNVENLSPSRLAALTGLVFVLSIVWSVAFNIPARVAEAQGIPPRRAWDLVVRAAVVSAVVLAVLSLVRRLLRRAMPIALLTHTATLVTLVAIALDIVEETTARARFGELVPAWELHQLFAVEPVLTRLRLAGVHAFPRGRRLRTLLQFFGPYVPVTILVPPGRVSDAVTIIQSPIRQREDEHARLQEVFG